MKPTLDDDIFSPFSHMRKREKTVRISHSHSPIGENEKEFSHEKDTPRGTITTSCAKCRKPLALDFGDVDGEMADVLREIAKRVVCNQCATPEPIPGPDAQALLDEPELFPPRRQFTVELPGQALATLDERLDDAKGRLLDIGPVKGARWRVRYLAPGPISFANE